MSAKHPIISVTGSSGAGTTSVRQTFENIFRREPITVAEHADLKIGVVPVINLEWIQKLIRDKSARGYSHDEAVDAILARMPDYVNFICPQFTETDINFQRVPTVDTSNPFVAPWIPTPDESMVIIRFR